MNIVRPGREMNLKTVPKTKRAKNKLAAKALPSKTNTKTICEEARLNLAIGFSKILAELTIR
ncbi:unnamed protein product, partial [marine sediment metagenome]